MKRDILTQISCLLFILVIGLTGCGKYQEMSSEGNGASVKVSLSGITEEEESATRQAESINKQTIDFHEGTSISCTISQEIPSMERAVQSIPDGTTYRVIVYKNSVSTSNWVASKQFSAGTATDNVFKFSSGGTYIFVCYSFNNTSNLPFDGSTGTLLANVNGNVDLLYKEITMNITDGTGASQNVLNIVFGHAFSRIKVKFVSQIGNITNLTGVNLNPHFETANLDFSNATLTYSGSSISKEFTFASTTPNASLTESSYSIFCLPATTASTLSIGTLTVNGTTKNNLTFNYNIQPGKSYTITFTLTQTGLTAYGLTWSSGNLVYDNASDTYNFTTTDGYGDYWFVNYLKPKILDGSNQSADANINGPAGDPCAKVTPINTWRLPTATELTNTMTATDANGASTNYNPLRYVATHYNSGNTNSNPGMFLGTQTDPGNNRANYVFFTYAGIYYNNNTNSAINTGGFYLTSDGYYLQIGNIWTYQLMPNVGDYAASIRCVKPAN